MNPHPEVLVVAGYAVVLLAAACVLDRAAQHVAVRSERFRTAGFRYDAQHDFWVCPQDEMLWPVGPDLERGIALYRAHSSVCNACPVKAGCTSSQHGREVTCAIAPWPHSEAGRFNRGICLLLIALATALCLAVAARHPDPASVVLGLPLLPALVLGHRFSAHFRNTPANFPAPARTTLPNPGSVPRPPRQ